MSTVQYPDAPAPTQEQINASRRYHTMYFVKNMVVISSFLIGVTVLPIVVFAAAWMLGERMGEDTWSKIFLSVGVTATYLMTVLMFLLNNKGRPLLPKDLQMFHCAELPLEEKHKEEVQKILNVFPKEEERVSQWEIQYEGKLRMRHLWELRRRCMKSHFTLEVVETNEPRWRGRTL